MAAVEESDPGEHRATRELVFKILVIGDYGVGKTAIIRRYTKGQFSTNYKLTIGVDFSIKVLNWKDTRINLQLWDIAGHERFGHMTRIYYKYAIAAVIVLDLSRPATFSSVAKWHADVKDKVVLNNGCPIPVILLANKCDIPGSYLGQDKLASFCTQHNIIGFFYTSAKDDINIREAMQFLVYNIVHLKGSTDVPQTFISSGQGQVPITLGAEEPVDQKNSACKCS